MVNAALQSTTHQHFVHNAPLLSLLKRSKTALSRSFAVSAARKRKENARFWALPAKNLRAKGGSGGFAGAVHEDDAKKVRHFT
jgi:hypothetical protein